MYHAAIMWVQKALQIRDAFRDVIKGNGTLSERVERNAEALLLVVLALAFVLRLGMLAVYHGDLYSRDEKGFSNQAWNISIGHGMGIAADCPTSYRAPLYIFFLVPFYVLFGDTGYAWPLGLTQVIFSVANIYLLYRIGTEWRSKRVGLIGALCMAIYPYNLYHDIQFYITFLFTFFMLLAVLGFLRLERTKSAKTAALTGLAIGFAMLATSGPMIFIAPLASFWLLWRWGSLTLAAKRVGLMAAMALLVMTPWVIRNWKVHHAFVPLTTDGGRVFYKAYHPLAIQMMLHGLWVDATPDPVDAIPTPMAGVHKTGCAYMKGYTELESQKYYQEKAWEWVRANPGETAGLLAMKFNLLWRPWMWTPKDAAGGTGAVILSAAFMNWGYALSYGFVLVFGVLEWAFSSKEERKRTWLFAVLAIAFTITYVLTVPGTKYRVPFDSILALMAASCIWRWYEAWRARRPKP